MKNFAKTGWGLFEFYRGGAPKNIHQLLHLHSIGVRTIISLQTGFADSLGDYPQEKEDWETLGGTYHCVKCSNFWAPSEQQTALVMELMGNAFKPNKGLLYLHCFSGVDRTGWMSARFRLKMCEFASAKRAWAEEAWAKGTHWWFFWWGPIFKSRY